jgi:hypothetical protein
MQSRSEKNLKLLTVILPFSAVLFLVAVFWWLARPLAIENYCVQESERTIPKSTRSEWVELNESEKAFFSKRNEMPEVISKGYRAEIECRIKQNTKIWPGL